MAPRYKSIRNDRAVELEKELSEKVAELMQKAQDADSKEEGKDEHLNQEMEVLVSVASESVRQPRKFDFRPHSHTKLPGPVSKSQAQQAPSSKEPTKYFQVA